ncbi:MAG: DMT family transporter [Deltaproteobacteria bacterium]|nr:DMT family transporter [Deltaproteobacteria bacterium]
MLKTIAIIIAGITAISFAAIFIRFCDDVPAIMIATYRLGIASLVLLVIFRFKGLTLRGIDRKDLLFSLLGGVFLSLHFILWITSLKYTSVASSVVLVTTNPIFVGIFSYFFLREKQPIELIAGICLCFLGSFIIAIGDSGFHGFTLTDKGALIGDALALAGAVMASGYLIVGSKVRERLDILTYITVVYSISAIFLLITSMALQIPFTGYKPSSYLFLAMLAVVPQLIGHTSLNWALKHLKASMVAITILGEPIGAAILAYLFFTESVGRLQLLGMAMIFAAIIIASRKGKKIE